MVEELSLIHILLLITNDGPLAHRLLSPAHHVDKIYEAKIQGMADQVIKLRDGQIRKCIYNDKKQAVAELEW